MVRNHQIILVPGIWLGYPFPAGPVSAIHAQALSALQQPLEFDYRRRCRAYSL
jgi:hypothetical protein